MNAPLIAPALVEIPLFLLDPPTLAERETFDETALATLAESLRLVGLLHAIGVKRVGPRYEVIYGHRRYVAAKLADFETITARVFDADTISPEALKVVENAEREAVNAAEQAVYFAALLDRVCSGDTDRLATLVGRSRDYVETRLILHAGDPVILAAVRDKRISLGVARELNLIRRERDRRLYLDSAIHSGCTARLAQDWRHRANALHDLQDGDVPVQGITSERPPQPRGSPFECLMCGSADEAHDMGLYYIHNYCFKAIVRPFLRGLNTPEEPAQS